MKPHWGQPSQGSLTLPLNSLYVKKEMKNKKRKPYKHPGHSTFKCYYFIIAIILELYPFFLWLKQLVVFYQDEMHQSESNCFNCFFFPINPGDQRHVLHEQSDIQKTPEGVLSFAYKTCMLWPGTLLKKVYYLLSYKKSTILNDSYYFLLCIDASICDGFFWCKDIPTLKTYSFSLHATNWKHLFYSLE